MTFLQTLRLAAVALVALPAGAADLELRAELLRALDAGTTPPALLEQALADGTVEDQVLAVRCLAATADPADAPVLATFAAAPAAPVRRAAQLAAGRMGGPAAGIVRTGLGDPDPGVRAAASWAAAALGDALADELLARLAGETAPEVLELALPELWRLPAGAWESLAASFLGHGGRELRRGAAYALARTGGGDQRAGLRRAATDADPWVRAVALGGLGRGAADAGDLAALGRGLDDPDWRVAAAAAGALARQAGLELAAGAGARLRALLRSPHPHLLAAAIDALGAHPEVAAGVELRQLAEAGTPWPAGQALLALARRGDAAAAELVARWSAAPEAWRRQAAARATALAPTGDGTRWALDGGSELRLAWLEVVAQPPAELVRPLLEDPDAVVRAAALDALVQGGAPPPPEELLALARRWHADAAGDARASALGAALALEEGATRRAALELAAADPDPAVRAAVGQRARVLGLDAPRPVRAPRHPPEWYRELARWDDEPRWLDLVTVRGTVRLRLDPRTAPITSRTVWELAEDGFYDGLTIHRVVPDFVVQGGDPRGDGWGGPGFVLPDEPSLVRFDAGRVGIATSGPNTGGSQLFVTLLPADHLTGRYTTLGAVVRGMDVLERLQVGDEIRAARVASGPEPEPPAPILLGRVTWEDLAALPGWSEEWAAYEPDGAAVARLRQAAGEYRIVVVLGSWCSDSRREVPRLVKVLGAVGSDRFGLELWAVDRTRRVEDPAFPEDVLPGRTPDLVATIVVLDAATGAELGRVVETAAGPLEELLVELIAPLEGWR